MTRYDGRNDLPKETTVLTYFMFANPLEALDHVLGLGEFGLRETHPDDAAAIESARSGGWEICLRLDPEYAAADYRKVWERSEDEE